MNQLPFLAFLPVLLATCASGSSPADDPTLNERLAAARSALALDGPDAALALAEPLAREHPRSQAAHLLVAEASVQLAALDRPGLDKGLVLRDAVNAFQRARDLGELPGDQWLRLADAEYELQDYDRAREAAASAFAAFRTEQAPDERFARAALRSAMCDYQEFVALRQEERQSGAKDERGIVRPEPETLKLADSALTQLTIVQQVLPAEGYPLAATIFRWLDQHNEALATLERGVQRAPQVPELHLAFQDMLVQRGQRRALVGAYERFTKEAPGTTILVWYHGRALVLYADEHRTQGSFGRAQQLYAAARDRFGEYASMMPAHAELAAQWQAICELSLARTALDTGDLAAAQQHLAAADAASPATSSYDGETPRLKDSFGVHYTGLVSAIGRALSESSTNALERTMRFNAGVIERHPDRFGFVYNNAALAARDLGVAVARDGEGKDGAARQQALARAMELWEQSYRWYEAAVALSPDDPRIVNDCGLMLIYHLNRDYDRARELFDRAIEVGQRQLDALPQDAPVEDRRFLEEAVGDALQNVAVLLGRHRNRPFAECEPFLRRAVQYYPGERREAAHMLRQRSVAAVDASATNVQGGAPEKVAKAVQRAESTFATDPDAAMLVFDELAKEMKGYAPFHAARGEFALRYAKKAREAERGGLEFLFADAVATLQKAVELDSEPARPRQLLAEAQYDAGDMAAAATTASELLLHLQSQGGGAKEQVLAAHQVRANAGARAYMEQKQQGKDPTELLQSVRTSFRQLEQQGALDAGLAKTWATVELYAGAGAEAVAIYARSLKQHPDDAQLVAGIVDAAANSGQAALAVAALKGRTDATSLWYLGRAHFAAAADLRNATKNQEALAELDAAIGCFERSKQQNAEFRDSCDQWIAICLGSKGNLAYWMDDLPHAEQWLLESVRLRPDRITEDLGLQETTKRGVMFLADKYLKAGDLAKAEAITRAAAEVAVADVDLQNNAGLFARDHGNELERAGNQKEALAMYEHSYDAYARAQRLDPESVRLANDLALIAIWYLERDWEQSKQLLEEAIARGDRQLEAIPRGDVQQRQDLSEAIGDAWENLALWHLKHDKDAAAAKAAAEKSLTYHPGARRPGANRHLRAAEQLLQAK